MENERAAAALAQDPKAVFLTQLARELHRAGLATDQLEQTISATADAIGLQLEIFALPTNLTIAVGPRYAQQIVMLRMQPGRVNLRKLAYLHDLFARLQNRAIDLPQAIVELREIDTRCPSVPAPAATFAQTCVAIGVAVLLGGGLNEIVVAALIGAATGLLAFLASRHAFADRLYEVAAGFVAALIVAAYTHFVGPANLYVAVVAGVVVILPGYSLTLALHELANQDLIAGTARLGRVAAILLALGCGAFLAFAVAGPALVHAADARPQPIAEGYRIVAILLLTIGLSIDLDARARDFVWVFFACMTALAAEYVFSALPSHQVAPFLAALLCGLIANGGARYLRVPQPVLIIPAVHVLVPGALSYQSVLRFVAQGGGDAGVLAANAVIAAVLIVAGLLLSQLIVPEQALRVRPELTGPR